MTDQNLAPGITAAIEAAVERGLQRSVSRVLRVDLDDQDSINSLTDDLRYLRRSRMASEARSNKVSESVISATVGAAIAGAIAWLTGIWKTGGH